MYANIPNHVSNARYKLLMFLLHITIHVIKKKHVKVKLNSNEIPVVENISIS